MKKEDLEKIKHLFRPLTTNDIFVGNAVYYIEDHVDNDIIINEVIIKKIDRNMITDESDNIVAVRSIVECTNGYILSVSLNNYFVKQEAVNGIDIIYDGIKYSGCVMTDADMSRDKISNKEPFKVKFDYIIKNNKELDNDESPDLDIEAPENIIVNDSLDGTIL